jgi:hypothetical protein
MEPRALALAIREAGFEATQLAFAKAFPAPAEQYMTPQTPYLIVSGSDKTLPKILEQAMTEKFGYPPEYMVEIGAAIACNAGHNVVGFVIKGGHK